MEIRVDTDRLRDHLKDEYGTAAFNGSPAAIVDAWDVDRMSGSELCEKAEAMGIDLRRVQD